MIILTMFLYEMWSKEKNVLSASELLYQCSSVHKAADSGRPSPVTKMIGILHLV